jgi:sugar O-acyltransferase (sialic acid O-acetyltransferase NeuD family)
MKLLVAGAGGHGRVVGDTALDTGRYSSLGYLDDTPGATETREGWKIVGLLSELDKMVERYEAFAAGFGDAIMRITMLAEATKLGFDCSAIVHPSAVVSRRCSLAEGSVVIAGGAVNIGASLGEACIVNTGATVDHDCRLAEGVHVCPGAHLAGAVEVGPRSWIGIGAVVRQRVRIGADVIIGAGAVVVHDVEDHATVIGNPARRAEPKLR